MKHVSILIPEGHTSLVNIEGTHQILSEVNTLRSQKGEAPLFTIQLVGISHMPSQRQGLFTIKTDCLLHEVPATDLIIIPAIYGAYPQVREQNQAFLPWIVQQYRNGAEVASLCIGSFLLAATGLLKGKQCASHWGSANAFRALYPNVHLVDDRIITDDEGIYTSGGAYSYLNLLVYMIEKYAGRDIAILIAKTFSIDYDRSLQSPFMIFHGQKAHEDETVKQAQEFIERNFEEKISIDQLATTFALGRRSLERRFKKATCNTVSEYIQRVKIEAAKKDLETGQKSVLEVMYDVGYSDVKAFRTIFKKITGLSPIEYRNKYHKELVAVA